MINELAEHELARNLKNVNIRVTDNGYELYNSYLIIRARNFCRVQHRTQNFEHEFQQTKTAVSWIIHHNLNKYTECKELELLDLRLRDQEFQLQRMKKLLANSSDSRQAIFEIKSHELQHQIRRIKHRLQALSEQAHALQLRHFIRSRINT